MISKISITIVFFVLFFVHSIKLNAQDDSYCPLYLQKQRAVLDQLSDEYFATDGFNHFIIGNFISTGINDTDELIILDVSNSQTQPPRALLFTLCNFVPIEYSLVWERQVNPLFKWWNANIYFDKYIVGSFDGDSKESILCINYENGWSHKVKYIPNPNCQSIGTSNNSWDQLWGNSGSGFIGTWPISEKDDYIVGDFDGDGKDELLCMNINNQNWHLYNYENSNWNLMTSGGPLLGNFQVQHIEHFAVGKFLLQNGVNTTKDVLFTAAKPAMSGNPGWFATQLYSISSNTFWGTYNNGNNSFLGTESINDDDLFFGTQMDDDEVSELLRYNREWRFDLKSFEYYSNQIGFVGNGNVDFKGYLLSDNPKYASELRMMFGKFGPFSSHTCVFVPSTIMGEDNFELYCPESNGQNWLTGEDQAEFRSEEVNKLNKINSPIINVYPTITPNFINVEFDQTPISIYDIHLFNSSGVVVKVFDKISSSPINLDLSDLSNGFYVLTITSKNAVYSYKIILNKN